MILRALWLRPLAARPVRFLATLAGVAVGVASVVSTVLASQAAVSFLGRDVEAIAGAARVEVTGPAGVEPEALAALRPLAGVALLAPVVEDAALAPELGDLVRVLGVDLLSASALGDGELETGPLTGEEAFERMLSGRGAALSRRLARELGVAPGDALPLVARSRPTEVLVAALFEPERLAAAWDRTVVVDLATAQELFGRGARVDRVELLPRADLPDAELARRAAELLPPDAGLRAAPVAARRADGERMVAALEFNLTALSGVSVLVATVLVATTLATSVVQRRAAVALLRSLGASRGQLARAVAAEAAAIGVLGGAAGVALGHAGARAALGGVRASVAAIAQGAVTGDVPFDPRLALGGLLLGLASSLAAAVLPLRQALATPPVQGLRGEHPESVALRPWRARAALLALLVGGAALCASLPPIGDRPIFALAAALLLLSAMLVVAAPLVDLFAGLGLGALALAARTPLRVAQAALEAGRARAAWAAGAVGMAVGLAVAMSTMVGSFRRTIVDWTDQTMRSDLFVSPLKGEGGAGAGTLDPEVAEAALRLFGADAVDPYREAGARVAEPDGSAGPAVALGGGAFRVVAPQGGVPFVDGRPSGEVFREAAERGAALVNEPFQRRFGLGRGDAVELVTPRGVVRREIAGVYRDYSGHLGRVVLDEPDFLSLYPDEGLVSVSVFLPEGADVAAARRRLAAELGGRHAVEISLNAELRAGILRVFDRTFAVTVALQVVASAVAAIAIVTVLGALVRERRRELAVLRVLGASRAQVAAVVLSQALLLGLAGALGGLAVGLAVGWVLVAVVNVQSFGWTLSFLPPWGALAWTAGAVLPACVLAALAPALAGARTAPREALREAL